MNKYWIKTITEQEMIEHWADTTGFTLNAVLADTDEAKRQLIHDINRDGGGGTTDERIRTVFDTWRGEFMDGILRRLCLLANERRPGSVTYRESYRYEPVLTTDTLPVGSGERTRVKYGIELWLLNTPLHPKHEQ